MGMSIDESYKWLEYHKQGEAGKGAECIDVAIDTMRKYQKIKKIVDGVETLANPFGYSSRTAIYKIREVLEDGNDN